MMIEVYVLNYYTLTMILGTNVLSDVFSDVLEISKIFCLYVTLESCLSLYQCLLRCLRWWCQQFRKFVCPSTKVLWQLKVSEFCLFKVPELGQKNSFLADSFFRKLYVTPPSNNDKISSDFNQFSMYFYTT